MHLHLFPHVHWAPIIAANGYWLIFLVIALESAGCPFPGEAMLITAAIYAGHTHRMNIGVIVGVATAGAVFGSMCGYWIGRGAGLPLLHRYGRYVGLDERRLRLGQYIFDRHGGKIVFFGRFISVLRAFASILAGANGLEWRRFIVFTTAGSVVWAVAFGAAAYTFGRDVHRVVGPIGLATLVLGAIAVVVGWFVLRHHEAELQARADAAARVGSPSALRVR
jgi:membrane protein DedA with SNARE-associated domain